MIKITGILQFDPTNRTRKHKSQSAWKKVAIIKTNCDLDLYYAWFIHKRYNLSLNRSIRGSHISFINDIVDNDKYEQTAEYFNNKEIEFSYNPDVRTNGTHWWLNIECTDAENIRTIMGLDKTPYFGFHLSIGYGVGRNLEHSQYIHNYIKKFNTNDNL
jgi:hypothetical protein